LTAFAPEVVMERCVLNGGRQMASIRKCGNRGRRIPVLPTIEASDGVDGTSTATSTWVLESLSALTGRGVALRNQALCVQAA
jgi:hypothetical protein